MARVMQAALLLALAVGAQANLIDLKGSTDQLAEGTWLVKFYAPWCGHCQAMEEDYKKLASEVSDAKVARVDVTAEEAAGTKYGIEGFPTLLLFKEGKVYDYAGDRSVEDMKKFIAGDYSTAKSADYPAAGANLKFEGGEEGQEGQEGQQEQPQDDGAMADSPSVTTLTSDNFDAETADGAAWLVEFYAPWCGYCQMIAAAYEEVGQKFKDNSAINVGRVDVTANDALGTRFGIEGFPTILFIKDGKVYDFQGERDVASFAAYVEGGFEGTAARPLPGAGDKLEALKEEDQPNEDEPIPEERIKADSEKEENLDDGMADLPVEDTYPPVENDEQGAEEPRSEYATPVTLESSEGAISMQSYTTGVVLRLAFFIPRFVDIKLEDGEATGSYVLTLTPKEGKTAFDGQGAPVALSKASFSVPSEWHQSTAEEILATSRRGPNSLLFEFISEGSYVPLDDQAKDYDPTEHPGAEGEGEIDAEAEGDVEGSVEGADEAEAEAPPAEGEEFPEAEGEEGSDDMESSLHPEGEFPEGEEPTEEEL